jgi:hypothetical protein
MKIEDMKRELDILKKLSHNQPLVRVQTPVQKTIPQSLIKFRKHQQ